MKALSNNDYYDILLEACKDAFGSIELKEFLFTDEAMEDNKEVFNSKESIKHLGIDVSNNLIVNYQIERDIKVNFLRFLERQQLIFEKKHLIPRNDFYKKCLNSLNIKLTEWNKEGDRVLRTISDLGKTPDPLEFLEYMKWDIKNKSLQTIDTPERQQNEPADTGKNKPPQTKPKEFKDFFNKNVKIEVIEKIQKEFKDYDNKKMAYLIYLLHKEFNLINYSVNSRDMSRKHFVESLIDKPIKMQGINKCFEANDVKLTSKDYHNDNDYINAKETLSKAIK